MFAVTSLAGAACSGSSTTSGTGAPSGPSTSDQTRMNQIQAIGTHNSYHIAPEAAFFTALSSAFEALGSVASDFGDVQSLAYTAAPLDEQLDGGVRALELDLYADPNGDLFSHPAGPTFLQVEGVTIPHGLDQPGFKVLHIPDIDFESRCPTFVGCLQQIRDWSDAHPAHVPIAIQLELKTDGLPPPLDVTKPLPYDAARLDELDAEIRSVFSQEHLVTPDLVRGTSPTLREAVKVTGWPELADVRGRVWFYLDNGGEIRDTYLKGHPSLKGRVAFTSTGRDQPDGAVLVINDPDDGVQAAIRDGYIVRTRADSDPAVVAKDAAAAATDRDAALATGAQIVSTDYPPVTPASNGYRVGVGPGAQVRCNPIERSATCQRPSLER